MFHTGDSFLRLCRDGDYKSVQRLVIKIAETNSTEQQEFINRKDSSGNSPIHYATKPGNEKVLSVLLHYGASVSVVNNRLLTPLHTACEWCNKEAIHLLIKHHAQWSK